MRAAVTPMMLRMTRKISVVISATPRWRALGTREVVL